MRKFQTPTTDFEIDTEGQYFPDVPVQLMVDSEPVVVTEIIERQGNIIAVRVERGAYALHALKAVIMPSEK